MRRYVVLIHDHPILHWDWMLEWEGRLRTWRLEQAPDSADRIAAEVLPDHRLAYLDYEGPISGGRGTVVQWDSGTYRGEPDGEPVRLTVAGRRLSGTVCLECEAGAWTFAYTPASLADRGT